MVVAGGEFGEHGERPAPVLDITELSQERIAQLTLKLAEYKERDRASGVDAFDHPEWAFYRRGGGIFKAPVLDYILEAAKDTKRDLAAAPITLTEVATAMEGLFGFDLTASKTTDFLWSEERQAPFANFEKLIDKGNQYDLDFSDVYEVIWGYCVDGGRNVAGGTGLPEVPQSTVLDTPSES